MSEEIKEENKLHTKKYWVLFGTLIAAVIASFLFLRL